MFAKSRNKNNTSEIINLMDTRGCWISEPLFEHAPVFPVRREQGCFLSIFTSKYHILGRSKKKMSAFSADRPPGTL